MSLAAEPRRHMGPDCRQLCSSLAVVIAIRGSNNRTGSAA